MLDKTLESHRSRRVKRPWNRIDPASWLPFRMIRRMAAAIALNFSIRVKILISLGIVILMLAGTNALLDVANDEL